MTKTNIRSLTLTKLQRPRTGRAVLQRPHLFEQLNAAQNLTLVLAPAGYGKTTLLSSWLEMCDTPSAWLTLDEYDDAPEIFVNYLLQALKTLFPDLAESLATDISGILLPPAGLIARSLLNDLTLIQQDFILILDDYHVIRNQAIHDLLTEIVRHPPRALHLVIASRYDPPLPLTSLRARGHVVELRAADLRFSLDESEQFMRETMALNIDASVISQMTAKTEGWPAGLRLAALSLRQHSPTGPLAVAALSDNRFILNYLIDEVWKDIPSSVQDFLAQTSILDLLCGSLCEAVTGMVDRMFSGHYILEWLEQNDLFIVPAEEQRRWYRCHHMLRQMLRHELETRYDHNQIAELHLRASAWFAQQGYLDEALQHALAAQDLNAAAQIIATHRHQLMNEGDFLRLERWINLFPREFIETQADLLLGEVWLKYIRQQLSTVSSLLEQVEALLPSLPPDRAEHLQSEIDSRRGALLFWGGETARSIALAESALANLPLEWKYARGYARLFLAAGYITTGDMVRAYATVYSPDEPRQSPGYRNFLIAVACLAHWVAADPIGMVQAARQVLAANELMDRGEMLPYSHYHIGLYHYQRNELAVAESELVPLVLQPYTSHALCFLNSAVLLARLRQTQGRAEEAQQIGTVLLAYALDIRSEVILQAARAFHAELALRQGRLAEAVQWAEQFGTFRHVPAPFHFVPSIVLAQILLAQATPASRQRARELLADMLDYFVSIHYTTIQIQVLALQAALHYQEGAEPVALATLGQALTLAEPGRFVRLFVDLGEPLKAVLATLARHDTASTFITEILTAFGPSEISPLGSEKPIQSESITSASPTTRLTNREWQVLELLAKRYTDKEIAEALVISPKTVSSHLDHLSDKLGARGRRAIVDAAKTQGLLD